MFDRATLSAGRTGSIVRGFSIPSGEDCDLDVGYRLRHGVRRDVQELSRL
jgi:hypothetical protein